MGAVIIKFDVGCYQPTRDLTSSPPKGNVPKMRNPPPPPPIKKIECEYCGRKNNLKREKCKSCGANL